jgi:NAD(P)-dependent dehydrogenase (short-subunit alcohol dehydrogenase family)
MRGIPLQINDSTVALVTGGASGLGEATARRLHRAGAAVVLVDLPTSKGAELAAELGERVRFSPADVRDEAQVQAAISAAQELGDLRIVVTCAGVGTPGRVVGKRGPHDLEQFRQVVDINLVGSFNVLRLAAAAMMGNEPLDGDRGVVVMTASIAAYDGQIGQAAYSASKGGIVGLTLSAARDLADKAIRVTTIAPGTFETPMMAGLPGETKEILEKLVPHPSRLGQPAEYASLVAHIIDNPMLNGEVIRLDGALRMPPR